MQSIADFFWRAATSKSARRIGCSLLALFILHAAWPGVRSTPPAAPFVGSQWYNPYLELDLDGEWLKASFHSHGKAWLGVSDGENTNEELFIDYRRRGFDVVGISNYQRIRPRYPGEDLYVECYEHGWSIGGQHQTVIGARNVAWLDIPILPTTRHKQYILDHLRLDAELLVINHPNRKSSYTLDDMRSLSGYHGVEIRTRFAKGIDHWDAALSAGRPVWGFCADDCHSLTRGHIGNGWILARVEERSRAALLRSIRRGSFVSVRALNRLAVNGLRECTLQDGVLRIRLKRTADMIRFIGQDGKLLHWISSAGQAEYPLKEDDTYIRVELSTRGTFIYLNPIFRHDGDPFGPHFASTTSASGVLWPRCGGILLAYLMLALGFPSLRRLLRPLASSDQPVQESAT